MLNVHLVRSNEYDLSSYWEVINTLQAFDGPINFIANEEEIEIDEETLREEIVGDDDFYKLEAIQDNDYMPSMSLREGISYIPKKDLIAPVPFKDVIKWKDIFKECNEFRISNNIEPEDFIILLTERRNDKNWFTGGDKKANNIFVHTGYWDYIIEAPRKFPIAYECAASVLRKLMFANFRALKKGLHKTTIGCMNDFCEQKEQIILKLRTADICSDCIKIINDKQIDTLLVEQTLNVFDGLRKQMLFKNGFNKLRKPSRLEILNPPYQSRLILPDYGNIEIKLTPLEKTLYLLYLKYPEGIAYQELIDYKHELTEIYSKLAKTGSTQEIEIKIASLTNPTESSTPEKVSKIKTKFNSALGEDNAVNYIISGERGEKKKINLNRELIVKT